MKALVVASDRDRRAALLLALEDLGIDRFAAGSFEDASFVLAKWTFQLVVIDTGTEAAAARRFIGDHLACAQAPAVVLMAANDDSIRLGRDLDVTVVEQPSDLASVLDAARPAVLCVA